MLKMDTMKIKMKSIDFFCCKNIKFSWHFLLLHHKPLKNFNVKKHERILISKWDDHVQGSKQNKNRVQKN